MLKPSDSRAGGGEHVHVRPLECDADPLPSANEGQARGQLASGRFHSRSEE